MRKEEKEPPIRVLERYERVGDKHAWVERLLMDWGWGEPRETFLGGAPDGSVVLPLLVNGNILLVHQYRPFADGWSYELPGGMIDEGESPEAAALRELKEETGYEAREMRPLLTIYPHMTMSCKHHLFFARRLKKGRTRRDRGERSMTTREVSPTQLWEMILDGTIQDAKTIITFFIAKERGLVTVDKRHLEAHPF